MRKENTVCYEIAQKGAGVGQFREQGSRVGEGQQKGGTGVGQFRGAGWGRGSKRLFRIAIMEPNLLNDNLQKKPQKPYI